MKPSKLICTGTPVMEPCDTDYTSSTDLGSVITLKLTRGATGTTDLTSFIFNPSVNLQHLYV